MSGFAEKGHFTISVVDPVKQDQGGLAPYITYKVNTNTDRADFQYGQFSVIRRFKDFVWLSERLGEEFPGVINPPLPDKETLKRFDAEHIEKRRAELERYLARVAAHSELSGSAFFMTFLQADDAAMADKKEEVKVLKGGGAAAAGAGLLRYVLYHTHIHQNSSHFLMFHIVLIVLQCTTRVVVYPLSKALLAACTLTTLAAEYRLECECSAGHACSYSKRYILYAVSEIEPEQHVLCCALVLQQTVNHSFDSLVLRYVTTSSLKHVICYTPMLQRRWFHSVLQQAYGFNS
eukprot:1232-Heterococcus_DN1.PRE.3